MKILLTVLAFFTFASPSLAQTVHEIRRLDLRLEVPAGCKVSEEILDNIPTTRIKAEDQTFEILIQRIASPKKVVDGKTVAVIGAPAVAEYVRDLILDGVPDSRVLFQESGRTIRNGRTDRPVEQFYILEPRPGGDSIVQGRTLFPIGGEEYAAFSLYCIESEFVAKGRPAYERVLETVEFIDPADAQAQRLLMIEAGQQVMGQLSRSHLEEVVRANAERWERFYRIDEAGMEQELGFRVIRASRGFRGELDPGKPRERWNTSDRQEGYILRIDLRLLGEENRVTNASSIFFLSDDEQQEAWHITTEVRAQPVPIRATEIGMRDGEFMQVKIQDAGAQPLRVNPVIEGRGYLPQVKAYLLGPLLVKVGIAIETGFYCYQSAHQTIELRRDLLERTADGSRWKITTRLTADTPPQVSIYDDEGNRLRTTYADGSIWEPIEARRLAELWQRKNLPLK